MQFVSNKRCAVALLALSVASAATDSRAATAQTNPKRPLADLVKQLCQDYVSGFGSERTRLVYHHRLDGPRGIGALSSPADIASGVVRGQPLPYGYGSGVQDVALENGQLLFALCDAYRATGDAEFAELARWFFAGLRRVATVSPEPGFVPRGPHPDGVSYYRDSSRDQHAAMAEALWRYGRSELATDEDRRFIRRELDEMARRLERNDWRIMVEDGSRIAHVGFTWRQMTSIGAVSQLSFLSMVVEMTDDPHWREAYRRSSREQDARRWVDLLHPDAVRTWKPFTLYSNQFSQALVALKRSESDPKRREQIAELLRALARRALESDVFDPAYWRRLDWGGRAGDEQLSWRVARLGLAMDQPTTVIELIDAYAPDSADRLPAELDTTANKLLFGLPTAAFHKTLLSEDPELIARILPRVRRMVEILCERGERYYAGENFNRAVVLGLLQVAWETQHNRTGEPMGERVEDEGSAEQQREVP